MKGLLRMTFVVLGSLALIYACIIVMFFMFTGMDWANYGELAR